MTISSTVAFHNKVTIFLLPFVFEIKTTNVCRTVSHFAQRCYVLCVDDNVRHTMECIDSRITRRVVLSAGLDPTRCEGNVARYCSSR